MTDISADNQVERFGRMIPDDVGPQPDPEAHLYVHGPAEPTAARPNYVYSSTTGWPVLPAGVDLASLRDDVVKAFGAAKGFTVSSIEKVRTFPGFVRNLATEAFDHVEDGSFEKAVRARAEHVRESAEFMRDDVREYAKETWKDIRYTWKNVEAARAGMLGVVAAEIGTGVPSGVGALTARALFAAAACYGVYRCTRNDYPNSIRPELVATGAALATAAATYGPRLILG